MALKPEDRYISCRALSEDIERWMADEPVSAYREPWTQTLTRWLSRHRTGVTAAGAALLVSLVGTAAVLVVQTRANDALKLANAREKQANVELAAAKDREAARFNLAMDAIGVFHGRISSDFLLKQAEFVPLRNALLREATDFYRKLEAELGGQSDRRSLRALGLAYLLLGQLTSKVGSLADASAQLRRSVEIRRQLAAGPAADVDSRTELGRSLLALAEALDEAHSDKEADETYREAIAIFEGLVADDPNARGRSGRPREGPGRAQLGRRATPRPERRPGAGTPGRRDPGRSRPGRPIRFPASTGPLPARLPASHDGPGLPGRAVRQGGVTDSLAGDFESPR